MVLAALVLWLAPALVLIGLLVTVARARRFGPPMGNAVATGVAAAAMVLLFFDLAGLAVLGPWGTSPRPDYLYAVPAFAIIGASFAWALGWACAILYLGAREHLAGRAGSLRCPRGMHLALALVVLLGLVVFYREHVATLLDALIGPAQPEEAREPTS